MRAGSGWVETLRSALARRPHACLVGLIVLASFAERLQVSHECSLWLDEVTTLHDSWSPWPTLLRGASREHPPLMFWLTRLAMELFGRGETAMRLPSLLFGCVLLVAVYELCRELGLTPARSIVVMGSTALTPFFVRHATEARHYAILMAFVTLAATRAFRIARGEPRRRDLVGFLLATTAAAATHYFGVAYGFALLAFVVVNRRTQPTLPARERRRFALYVLATLGPLVGFAFAARSLGQHYGLEQATTVTANWQLWRDLPGEFALGASSAWAIPELLAATVGLVLLGARLQGFARLVPFALTFAPAACAPFLSAKHFVALRYLAPSFVFYHLGACVAWFALFDLSARAVLNFGSLERYGARLVSALFALPLVLRLAEFPNGYGAGGDDYASLQRYYREHLESDTGLVSFDGYFGHFIFDFCYTLGRPVIKLETFRPVRGLRRYAIVEIHVSGRQDELEKLVKQNFGISSERWRALPLLELPHTLYQPAPRVHLIELGERSHERHRKHVHRK